jgi:hypothetical protein
MAREIKRKDWDHTLHETTDGLVLTVLCGSSAMYLVSVALSADERARYEADETYLDELAASIRNSPLGYWDRRVPTPE